MASENQHNGRERPAQDFAQHGELMDFVEDLKKRKYSGSVEINFKRGEAKRWAKLSKFRKIGGDEGR